MLSLFLQRVTSHAYQGDPYQRLALQSVSRVRAYYCGIDRESLFERCERPSRPAPSGVSTARECGNELVMSRMRSARSTFWFGPAHVSSDNLMLCTDSGEILRILRKRESRFEGLLSLLKRSTRAASGGGGFAGIIRSHRGPFTCERLIVLQGI
jgi:hypothetical protein